MQWRGIMFDVIVVTTLNTNPPQKTNNESAERETSFGSTHRSTITPRRTSGDSS